MATVLPSAHQGSPDAMRWAWEASVAKEVLYMDIRGIQAVTWAMLLLYDQECKAGCHDGHGTAI